VCPQVVLVGGPLGSGGRGVALALAAALEACAMPAQVLHLSDFTTDPPQPRGFAPVSSDDPQGSSDAAAAANPALRRLERAVAAAAAAFAAAAAGGGSGGGAAVGMGVDTSALALVVAQALASAAATGLRCLIIEGVAALDPAVWFSAISHEMSSTAHR
jgi:hypothetical protein